MAVNRNLVRKVMTIVGTAGPIVAKYLKEHPEIAQSVQASVTKLLEKRSSGPGGMRETIAVLREQVHFLRTSADDEAEARRAEQWSRRLDKLDHAAAMLQDGGSRAEVKTLRDKILTLRGEILAAFIAEKADDAERGQIGP
jgi:hypothetical protein